MDKAKLLWVDLEMTGLDPVDDSILEVAAIATDWDFKEYATLEAVVKIDEAHMKQRMVGEFWDKYDVVRQNLQSQNASGALAHEVEQQLIEFIDQNFEPTDKVILAGNSIHQDRKFIENEWPELNQRLHYRMLDVSAWKLVFEGRYRKKFSKPEAHRALSDIRGSIEELKYYLKKLDKLK